MRRLAVLLLVGVLVGTTSSCSVYTATRTRVLDTQYVEEPGDLVSRTPKTTRVDDLTVRLQGVERRGEPCVVAQLSARRTLVYDAQVVRRRVEQQLRARADRIVTYWPSDDILVLGEDPIMFLLVGWIVTPVLIVWDMFLPPYEELAALLYAGSALDEIQPGNVATLQNDEQWGSRTIGTVSRTTEVFPPEKTDKTVEVTRSVDGPAAGADATVSLQGHAERWRLVADDEGRIAIPLVDLAAVAGDEPAPTLAVEALGLTRTVALDGAALTALATARPQPVAAPSVDSAGTDGRVRELLVEAGAAEEAGDLPGAARVWGTLLALEPAVAKKDELERSVPRLLREIGEPLAAPAEARSAADRAADAVAAGDAPRAREASEEAVARAPWWNRGHELRAAALRIQGEREAAAAELDLAVALTAEGSDESRSLRSMLVRWRAGR